MFFCVILKFQYFNVVYFLYFIFEPQHYNFFLTLTLVTLFLEFPNWATEFFNFNFILIQVSKNIFASY